MAETGIGYVSSGEEDFYSKQDRKLEILHYKFKTSCPFVCTWCDYKSCPFIKFTQILRDEL